MKQINCPVCKGPGLSTIDVVERKDIGKFNCSKCDGNGFILTESPHEEEFTGKKFIDGVKKQFIFGNF